MVTTNHDALATFTRQMRHHGQGTSLEEIVLLGNDWMMDEIRAVVCKAQVDRLDEFVDRRRAIAAQYDRLLSGDKRFTLPRPLPGSRPSFYKYPVILPEGVDGGTVRTRMMERFNVEAGSLYSPPVHLMPVFKNRPEGKGLKLPVAEALLPRQVTLPIHASLQPGEVERSVEALHAVLKA
jgi:dTDP-4-amino-4,6-dideoxygalactose transaminase